MIRNPKYVYGKAPTMVPSDLNFGQFMVNALWKHQDKVAFINGESHERITYKELVQKAMNLAISLRRLGIGKGDTVAVCSENRQEYWSTIIGIACTGATVTLLNIMYTKDELFHVLNISKPRIMFLSPLTYNAYEKYLGKLPHVKGIVIYGNEKKPDTYLNEDLIKIKTDSGYMEVKAEHFEAVQVQGQVDTVMVLYSSGTTGLPKGVAITHLNLLNGCCGSDILDSSSPTFSIAPWCHVMGITLLLGPLCSGGTLLYLPKFQMNLFLNLIERYKVCHLVVSPPVIVLLSKSSTQHDLSSVKTIFSGGAPLSEDTIQTIKRSLPNLKAINQGYGMTEIPIGVIVDKYDEAHLAKESGIGFVYDSCVVKVVDIETRRPLGPTEVGEICVKSPSTMKGYIGVENREHFDEEGFFKTGDIGYYDKDKYFFIVDRLKELIKYKGYQVPPAEIEATLLQHPDIKDAGVIGIPHEIGGEVPRAFVVLQPGKKLTEKQIQDFIAEKLSNPKHLRGGVCFVNEIPKNVSGKILRKRLREMKPTNKL